MFPRRIQFLGLFSLISLANINPVKAAPTPSQCTLIFPGYQVQGVSTEEGACRYVVKYGEAERWGVSKAPTSLSGLTSTSLPPACPQDSDIYTPGVTQSEDCLWAAIYVPTAVSNDLLPVYVWIHGGSYYEGSVAAPGLDGSTLAAKGNIIVVVLQYRLGVLGFLPPTQAPTSSDPNLGLQDIILALTNIREYIAFVGGDKDKVTVGGQSSGAQIVRALWNAPAAVGLFRAAILQSDPMDYGFSPPEITANLTELFYSTAPANACSTLDCLKAIPADQLVTESVVVGTSAAALSNPGVPPSEPIRPTYNTLTLLADPTSELFTSPASLAHPPESLPLLITTVRNEAGSTVQSYYPSPVQVSNETYYNLLVEFLGPDRAQKIFNSGFYDLSYEGGDGDEFRELFELFVTDWVFRSPSRAVAREWAANGGKVWVGEFEKGSSYPDNTVGYCQKEGVVCHEDDIEAVFQTGPTGADAIESEILSYWISFIYNLDPNPSSSSSSHKKRKSSQWWWPWCYISSYILPRSEKWEPYTSTSTVDRVYPLGSDLAGGHKAIDVPEGFWGEVVKWDWQLYG
ncbi:hypothetical protein M231_05498 [Tremella mesenterica]|uniref:Carboxylesterase type B domain-containing protein n=1 Tax=Tremella mesenterica TaxID=5217 RepID=A0A4Q1BHV1_TREME|nr:hypothetical protein M231_05498 [Tremella mesenterica]